MKKYIVYVISVAVLLMLFGCGKQGMQIPNDIQGDSYPDADQYVAGDFTYDSADVDAIELNWRMGKVELVESDSDTLTVSESGEELDADEQMHHYLDGHTLHIQFCHSGSNVLVQSRDKHLRVELPKGINLSIYNTSADIHAEQLELKSVLIASQSGNLDCGTVAADSIDLSTSSGKIVADRITGTSLKLGTSSGEVDVDSVVLSGSVFSASTSGNVTLGSVETEELTVSTASGNVNLETGMHCPAMSITTASGNVCLTLPKSGGRVNFVSASGALKTELPYESVGDLRVFGEGGSEIHVDTASGNLEIE